MIKELNRTTLNRLYIKEKKSLAKIAEMFSCTPLTVLNKCRQHGIKTRQPKRIEGLNESLLKKLYLIEKKTTREIATMFGCSYTNVNYRCRKYGIKLRPQTCKMIHKRIHLP